MSAPGALNDPQAYVVALPFRPVAGGAALDVVPTSTGVIVEIPTWARVAETIQLYNDSAVDWWLLFGTSAQMTKALGLACPPGALVVYTLPGDGTYTHFCVMTRSGSATGTVNFGLGS